MLYNILKIPIKFTSPMVSPMRDPDPGWPDPDPGWPAAGQDTTALASAASATSQQLCLECPPPVQGWL